VSREDPLGFVFDHLDARGMHAFWADQLSQPKLEESWGRSTDALKLVAVGSHVVQRSAVVQLARDLSTDVAALIPADRRPLAADAIAALDAFLGDPGSVRRSIGKRGGARDPVHNLYAAFDAAADAHSAEAAADAAAFALDSVGYAVMCIAPGEIEPGVPSLADLLCGAASASAAALSPLRSELRRTAAHEARAPAALARLAGHVRARLTCPTVEQLRGPSLVR